MSSSKSASRRSVDAESRKPKLSAKKDVRPPSPIKDRDEDESDDVKSDLSADELDDSSRPPVPKNRKKKSVTIKDAARSAPSGGNEDEKDVDESSPDSKDFTTSPSIAILRGAAAHFLPETIEHTQVSNFIPASYQFFMMLFAIQDLLLDNRYLRKILPGYNTLCSSLYYSILFVVQVLRARKISCVITSGESKALRTFERNFPFESLPVLGPMAGFLEMLGALKLSDPRYTWVVPALPTFAGTVGTPTWNTGMAIFPFVPYLISLLNGVARATKAGKTHLVDWTKGTTDTEHFVKFGQHEYSRGFVRTSSHLPGVNRLSDYVENFRAINRFIKSANFPSVPADYAITTVERFLCAEGTMTWFSHLIKHASIEADFFKGKTNFSKISPSSDLTMLTELTYDEEYAPAPMTADQLKASGPFDHERLPIQMDTRSLNAFHRVVTTSSMQFQIGMSTGFIIHRYKHDGTGESDHTTYSSISRVVDTPANLAGPYFSSPAEKYPYDGHGFVAESNLNIAKIVEEFTSPANNFPSLLVEHFFLEKGKRTQE